MEKSGERQAKGESATDEQKAARGQQGQTALARVLKERNGERQEQKAARSQGQTALASVRSEGDKPNFKQLAKDIIEDCDVDGSETLNAAEAFACIEANEDKIRE